MLPLVASSPDRGEAWRALAACREAPHVDTMYPTDETGARVALRYCARCPVVAECWQYAVTHKLAKSGTWGGTVVVGNRLYEV